MKDDILVKEPLYGVLFNGSQPVGRLYLRHRVTCKNTLTYGHFLDLWMTVADRRQEWRKLIRTFCESDDTKRVKEDERQREKETRNQNHILS